ncbi:MAG: AsmA family protein [Beijerinckiaceae bacterium]
MRRAWLFAGALGVLAAGFAPWPVPAARLQAMLAGPFSATDGATLHAARTGRFSLFPMPAFTLKHVVITTAGGDIVAAAPKVTMRLRVLPLVAGQFAPHDIVAYTPAIALDDQAAAFWVKALARRDGAIAQSSLTIVDGRTMADNPKQAVTGIHGAVAWQDSRQRIDLWGKGAWRDQPVELRLTLGGHAAASDKPATLMVQTSFAQLEASGTYGNERAAGTISLAMKDGAALAAWLGKPVPLAGLLNQFEMTGKGTATMRGLALSEARLKVAGDELTGTVAATREADRFHIGGTLATNALTIGLPSAGHQSSSGPDKGWSQKTFAFDGMSGTDLDLRISATRARIGNVTVGDAALSATLKNGRLDLALGRSTAYGGTLRGRSSITRIDESHIEHRAQLSFESIDVGRLSDDLFGSRIMAGNASGQWQSDSQGQTAQAIAAGLNGRAAVTVRQGEISGINLAEMLRRAERESAQGFALQGGRTRFDEAKLAVHIHNGVATLSEGQVSGGLVQATLGGQILIGAQVLRLQGAVLHPLRPRQWPFEISGPWRDPATHVLPVAPAQRSQATGNLPSGG